MVKLRNYIAAIGTAALPIMSGASVLGEARYLMRTPYDSNGDGYLSNCAGELPDALHAADSGSALNDGHSNAPEDNLAAILISTEDVRSPYTGFVDEGVPCIKLTASPRVDGDAVTYRPQSVQLPSLFDFTYTNDYTFAIRFRCDGTFTNWDRLLILGLSEISEGGGAGLSFGFQSMTDSYGWYWFSFGGAVANGYIGGIGTNRWIDVVGVMDGHGKKLTVYTSIDAYSVKTNAYDYPASTETVSKPYSSSVKIGYVDRPSWETPASGMQSFKGTVAQLAIWDRALTGEEAVEVMATPQPYSWKIGEDDGASGEFAGATSGERCSVGQRWTVLPHELTAACPNFEVSFPFDRGYAISAQFPARNVLLSIKMANDSGVGRIRLMVNGTTIKDMDVTAGEIYTALVKAECILDGNVLSVTRLSGGPLKFDWLGGGDSWQIGFRDNNYTQDGFAGQGIRYHRMENLSFGTFSRNLNGPGDGGNTVNFYVNMPQEYCSRIRFGLELRWWHMSGYSDLPVYDSVILNGTSLGATRLEKNTKVTTRYNIPTGLLQPGINHFRIARTSDDNLGASDWDPIDYVALEPKREIQGVLIVVY